MYRLPNSGICARDPSHTEPRVVAIDLNAHQWNNNWAFTTPPTIAYDGTETDTCARDASHARTRPITTVTIDSIAGLGTYLSNRSANTATTAYKVSLNVNNLGGDYNTVGSLGKVLQDNDAKYVSLDLSGSTITSIPDIAFNTGNPDPLDNIMCTTLVGITIPDIRKTARFT